jgi:hypothetical protein
MENIFNIPIVTGENGVNKIEFIPLSVNEIFEISTQEQFDELVKNKSSHPNGICELSIKQAFESFCNWRDYITW